MVSTLVAVCCAQIMKVRDLLFPPTPSQRILQTSWSLLTSSGFICLFASWSVFPRGHESLKYQLNFSFSLFRS